jgi:hypothetical protein
MRSLSTTFYARTFRSLRLWRPLLGTAFFSAFLCLVELNLHAQSYTTSWIGNSNGGAAYSHIPLDVDDIAVSSDGTVYTNCRWDEDRREITILKDGALINKKDWDAHAGGHSGGDAIAVNTHFVYVAQGMAYENNGLNSNGLRKSPAAGHEWSIIRRYDRSGNQSAFSLGYGNADSMLPLHDVKRTKGIIVENSGGATAHVAGLAATDSELYVSDRYAGMIHVYDASTMALLREWSVARPGKLTVQSDNIWLIQDGDATNKPKVLEYSTAGVLQSAQIDFAKGGVPTAIAWNSTTSLLMVADNGPDQNVKMYDVAALAGSPTKVNGTFGITGGIYSGTKGVVGESKFNGISGMGSDQSGNIYVAQNGQGPLVDSPIGYDVGSGTVIESYSNLGIRNWVVYGLAFVDCADVDSTSETDVYTGDKHYTIDLTKPDGKQWAYKGYTIDRFSYPQDPRLNMGNVNRTGGVSIRNILGHKFMFLTDMNGHSLSIFRFNGEIAVPSGFWSPFRQRKAWMPNEPDGEWIWRDANGNGNFDAGEYSQPPKVAGASEMFGRYIDSKGNIWMCSGSNGGSVLKEFPVGDALDASGNPQYSFETMKTFTLPSEMRRVERVEYDANADVMYLGGYLSNETADTWGIFKRVARISKWTTGNRNPDWITAPDYAFTHDNNSAQFPKAMSIAGDYLFIAYFSPRHKHVSVYNLSDGKPFATLTPGPEIGQVTGDVDIPQGIRAYKRADGNYLIFQEDDARAKVVMYRWSPNVGAAEKP